MTLKRLILATAAVLWASVLPVQADTFKNRETGEVFHGFRTQKQNAQKTLVYNEGEKKFIPLDLSGYDVVSDDTGRRNTVTLVNITKPEIMLSGAVSKTIAEAIIRASNAGPRFILLQIDSPGGNGMYMQTICQAIAGTDNCPVVAYISGGTFGGAHSTAAVVALACSRIYIAPTASISAVGPYVSTGKTPQQQTEYANMYCPDSLASFSAYAGAIAAGHNRPELPAKALLDKRISIVEVMDINGNKSLVEKTGRLPDQTIIRTLTEGLAEPAYTQKEESPAAAAEPKQAKPPAAADIYSRTLTLNATDAMNLKLADAIAGSVPEVIADMKAADAQIATASGIDDIIQKFTAGKRNIAQALARIESLEDRSSSLEEQLNEVEKQARTATVTKRTTSGNAQYQRGRVRMPGNFRNYYPDVQFDNNAVNDGTVVNSRSHRPRDVENRQTVESREPAISTTVIGNELAATLRELVSEYRRTIGLAKRWAGALPPDITVASLQKNMESATALADSLQLRR